MNILDKNYQLPPNTPPDSIFIKKNGEKPSLINVLPDGMHSEGYEHYLSDQEYYHFSIKDGAYSNPNTPRDQYPVMLYHKDYRGVNLIPKNSDEADWTDKEFTAGDTVTVNNKTEEDTMIAQGYSRNIPVMTEITTMQRNKAKKEGRLCPHTGVILMNPAPAQSNKTLTLDNKPNGNNTTNR